eukprot:Opistho-1_new@90730
MARVDEERVVESGVLKVVDERRNHRAKHFLHRHGVLQRVLRQEKVDRLRDVRRMHRVVVGIAGLVPFLDRREPPPQLLLINVEVRNEVALLKDGLRNVEQRPAVCDLANLKDVHFPHVDALENAANVLFRAKHLLDEAHGLPRGAHGRGRRVLGNRRDAVPGLHAGCSREVCPRRMRVQQRMEPRVHLAVNALRREFEVRRKQLVGRQDLDHKLEVLHDVVRGVPSALDLAKQLDDLCEGRIEIELAVAGGGLLELLLQLLIVVEELVHVVLALEQGGAVLFDEALEHVEGDAEDEQRNHKGHFAAIVNLAIGLENAPAPEAKPRRVRVEKVHEAHARNVAPDKGRGCDEDVRAHFRCATLHVGAHHGDEPHGRQQHVALA